LSGADFWQQPDPQRQTPSFIPQQQRLNTVFAQCEETLPAARDDPHKYDSPPLSPIAIRQAVMNRIGRPQRNTANLQEFFRHTTPRTVNVSLCQSDKSRKQDSAFY
jgi:hypothetical protein